MLEEKCIEMQMQMNRTLMFGSGFPNIPDISSTFQDIQIISLSPESC